MPNAGTPTEVSYCNSERSYKSSVFQRSTSTRSGRWAELLQLHSPFNGCRFLPIQHQSITRVPNAFLHRICSPVARARSRLHRKSPKMTSWYWSGKSRFIKALLQSDDTAKRGQHPCTKNVQALKCNFNSGCNNVVFIDTPSFHTELEDFDVENQMPTWMKVKLTAKCPQPSGHSLSLPLPSYPTRRHAQDYPWHLSRVGLCLGALRCIPKS